ncbi:MAG: ABC transporter ATP-binding protein [Planctomycetota bacterium]|nr:ABC transporter ATP-binding protein [Planctomycetota bacterium]
MSSNPVVACQSLVKVFKDFWLRDRARAVDGVTFTIEPHEVFGLLGPNGSGKSTTIKMILGLLKPDAGRISVFGKLPSDVSIKKRIGYLPEESYLYQFLNARETLDYYGKLFELDRRTRLKRIDELLDMVGLAGAQFRPVREYSKGMQRRIGLAQALINDPEFLILDEPTTGLDPIGTRQVKDLIIELGRRGKTVLLSSHLLSDVEDCVNRMVILYGGKVREEGTCESLLESEDKITIEADTLDDATIEEIDRIIRSRSGNAKSVLKVARPRQRLEDLFMQIVDKARSQQVTTSGATSGGVTASFLRADVQGDDLIKNLVSAPSHAEQDAARVASTPAPAAPVVAPTGPDANVVDALIKAKAPETERPAASTPARPAPAPAPRSAAAPSAPVAPPAGPSVDLGLIGSLLDDAKRDAKKNDSDKGGAA